MSSGECECGGGCVVDAVVVFVVSSWDICVGESVIVCVVVSVGDVSGCVVAVVCDVCVVVFLEWECVVVFSVSVGDGECG